MRSFSVTERHAAVSRRDVERAIDVALLLFATAVVIAATSTQLQFKWRHVYADCRAIDLHHVSIIWTVAS